MSYQLQLVYLETHINPKSLLPIPMCCQGYIDSTRDPLTVDSCSQNCFDGDAWYPLYNIDGTNIVKKIRFIISKRYQNSKFS